MKKLNIVLVGLLVFFSACKDPYYEVVGEGEALKIVGFVPDPSSPKLIEIDQIDVESRLFFKWGEAESGMGSPVEYTFLLDDAEGDFSEPIIDVTVGEKKEYMIRHNELRALLQASDYNLREGAKLAWKVKSQIVGDESSVSETPIFVTTVTLKDFEVFVTGSFMSPSWDRTEFLHLARTDEEDPAKRSVTLWAPAGVEFKFTSAPNWDEAKFGYYKDENENVTDSIVNSPVGANFTIPGQSEDAYYKLTFNTSDWSFSSEKIETAAIPAAPAGIYMIGSFAEWNWDNAAEFTQDASNPHLWSARVRLGAGEFKFTDANNWDGNIFGVNNEYPNGALINSPASGNIMFEAESEKVYDVFFDSYSMTYWMKEVRLEEIYSTLHLVGDATDAGWTIGDALPFRSLGGGSYEIYAYLQNSGTFKFPFEKNWDNDLGMDQEGTLKEKGGNISAPAVAGMYRISVNIADLTYSLQLIENIYIVGSATTAGWDAANALQMTFDEPNRRWTLTTTLTPSGNPSDPAKYKFIPKQAWDGFADWSGNETGDLQYGGDIVFDGTAGTYEIVFDPANWTYSSTLQ